MFRQLDHTADLAIEVEAPTLEELFGEALKGLTDTITDLAGIGRSRRRAFAAAAPELDLLLVAWLDELLYAFDSRRELYAEASVELARDDGGWRLAATAVGERWDDERHRPRVAIKGVTYHALRLERRGDGWRALFVLDV